MSTIFLLMGVFSKVALGAFGGGLATIPFIHHELVAARAWLTEEMFSQTIALAQMTPGPVALNSATFVGFRLGGFWGSLLASVALVGTPVLIIALLLWFISRAPESLQKKIAAFQKGLRPAVAGLLLAAFFTLLKPILPSFSSFRAAVSGLVLIALAVGCWYLSKLRPFRDYPQLIILAAALAGLCLKWLIVY
ncbi:MAG: chromate transporter [Synergistaceae bacterium]|nr:chromate transporter [Synergistaceae bacterium]